MTKLPLRDGPQDGDKVCEAGLIYTQMSQSSQHADESTMECSWHVLRRLTRPSEPKAAEMRRQVGNPNPSLHSLCLCE